MFKKIALYLFICSTIISCRNEPLSQDDKYDPTQSNPTPQYLKNNSFLSSGIDFETGAPVVFNSLSGRKTHPCLVTEMSGEESSYKPKQEKKQPCEITVTDLDNNVLAAIEASKSYIEGTVIRNGKKIKTRIFVEVTMLYNGSFCATKFIGGDQYSEVCFNETNDCKRYKDYIEPYVRAYYADLPENEIKQIILNGLPTACKTES